MIKNINEYTKSVKRSGYIYEVKSTV